MRLTGLLAPMLFGITWMDPNWLLDQFGTAFFWVSLAIIFVECGLFFPFLPGDTLLVAMGIFIASENISIIGGGPLVNLAFALVAAHRRRPSRATSSGYEIGRKIGPPLYEHDGRILKREYFEKTEIFFEKHGSKALVIGRFVPFVRTYITVVAGATRMDRRKFFVWSLVGAVTWVAQHHCCSATSSGQRSRGSPRTSTTPSSACSPSRSSRSSIEWWRHHDDDDDDVGEEPEPGEVGDQLARRYEVTASRSALVSTARTSRPTSASGFPPAGLTGRSRRPRGPRSRRPRAGRWWRRGRRRRW